MVNPDTIRSAVGVLGNIISFGLFLSPLPTFITILKKKAVEQYSPIPYLATYINCLLWVLYGLPVVHPDSLLIITINGIGLVMEGIYILIFLIYSPPKLRTKVALILVGEYVFVGAVAAVVLLTAHTHEKRSFIVGIFCVIFGTGMYAAPLAVMKMVIQTKSVKYMPFMLSFAGFLNGLCWLTYALIKFDIFVTVPNGLGVLFGAAQLVLYACYYKSTPSEKEHIGVEMSETSRV